jgi:hypothetical protein
MRWPYFGLTATPNAGNWCAPLNNILAGQLLKSLVMRAPVSIYGSRGWGLGAVRRQVSRSCRYRLGVEE